MKSHSRAVIPIGLDKVWHLCGAEIPTVVSPGIGSDASKLTFSAPSTAASAARKLRGSLAALVAHAAARIVGKQGYAASRTTYSGEEGCDKLGTLSAPDPKMMHHARQPETGLAVCHAMPRASRRSFLVAGLASLALMPVTLTAAEVAKETTQTVAQTETSNSRTLPGLQLKKGEESREAGKPVEPVVAIFTANRIGTIGDSELKALEDYITGRITELNVRVISSETAINAVSGMTPEAKVTALDKQLAESTSAVRLAEALGATHILQVTITGFDASQKTIDAYGVKTINDERTARVTYKILDGGNSASMAADTVTVSKMVQQSREMSDQRSDVLNGLLDEAAQKVAVSLKRQLDRGRITASTKSDLATVTITTELADLYIPDVRIEAENTISISASKFKVSALNATIEVDGIAVGTAPGPIQARTGLHKLRVVREGYKPWERTVNFSNGQKLNVALEMTEAGYARWQDATAFINGLKNGAKLTDAEVEVLRGRAKMLEQSGFKVDTKEGIQITNKSLF